MNCSKCGKFLGWGAAVLKGKDICKKCGKSFSSKAEKECGLLVVSVSAKEKTETANVYMI